MTLAEAITKRINELLFEKGWSLYKLSKESGLPLSTIKNLYSGHTKSPTLSVIFKIARAFDMNHIEFLNNNIFFDEKLDFE